MSCYFKILSQLLVVLLMKIIEDNKLQTLSPLVTDMCTDNLFIAY